MHESIAFDSLNTFESSYLIFFLTQVILLFESSVKNNLSKISLKQLKSNAYVNNGDCKTSPWIWNNRIENPNFYVILIYLR
jgi:hypothetical protein